MKKILSILSIFYTFFFIVSCSGGGADKEPNNEIQEASVATYDEPFEIKIDPVGDVDWFKVDVPKQGYLSVQANNIDEALSLEVRFAQYQEWEGEKEKDLTDWLETPAVLHVVEPGTYYFVIADNYNDASSTNPISVKVNFTEEMDEFEVNDNFDNAKAVENGQVLKLFIYPKADQDWFMYKADKKGYLKVMNSNSVDDINPEVKFLKLDQTTNKTEEITGWMDLPAACFISEPENVYILVHDDYDDNGKSEALEFKFEFVDNFDLTEPNDEYQKAAEVKRKDTLNVAIFPIGDNDYYKIKIEEGAKIKLRGKDWDEAITPELKLYSLDTVAYELKEISEWEKLPTEFDVVKGETYYIRIHDDYDDKGSEKPFKIIIE